MINKFNNIESFYKYFNKGKFQKYLAYIASPIFLDEKHFSSVLFNGGWNLFYRKQYMHKTGYEALMKDEIERQEIERFNNSGNNTLEKYMNYYLSRLIHDFMVKVDRTSMANSIEVRSPFLDKNMIRNINKTNPGSIIDVFESKKELKKILHNEGFNKLTNVKKQGFTPPLSQWMTSEKGISSIRSVLGDKRNSLGELFDTKKLTELTQEKDQIKKNYYRIWNLMIFSRWMSLNY